MFYFVDAIPLASGGEILRVDLTSDIGIRMGVADRPPDCSMLDTIQFADHMSELCIVEEASVIVGDFNFNFDSRYSIFPVKSTRLVGSPLGNFLLENGFLRFTDFSTKTS